MFTKSFVAKDNNGEDHNTIKCSEIVGVHAVPALPSSKSFFYRDHKEKGVFSASHVGPIRYQANLKKKGQENIIIYRAWKVEL